MKGCSQGIGVPTTYALLIGLGGSMGDIIAPCSPQIAAQSTTLNYGGLKNGIQANSLLLQAQSTRWTV